MSWYAEAVTIPLTGATKLYSRTTIPHNNPLYTKLYSKSNALRQVPFTLQPLNQTHPLDCQMEKYDLSLHKSCIHCSRVQWWHALNHCMWCFALCLLMWGLDAAAWSCKTHPWSSLCTVLELILRPEVWRSVAIDSAESWRLCTLWSSASADPTLWFYTTYHFIAALLSFPIASTLL